MPKKNVAVVMGGYSSEFEISLNSGLVVCESLQATGKYRVYPVRILKEKWVYVLPNGEEHLVNKADFSFSDGDKKVIPDVVYNTIHGTPGEDGLIQAYLELLGIPHTSSAHYPSALTMNKRDTLSVLKRFGILCANSYYINKGDSVRLEEVIKTTGLPCFVKPSKSGSSFGVSKVRSIEEFPEAFKKAFAEDSEILVEAEIQGTEVSVGAMKKNGVIQVFPPTEIVSENEFFDYDAKYLGKSQEITPARITEGAAQKLLLETERIYKLLNLSGLTRTDFIICDEKPYFIEVNTNPGLSRESIVPKQAAYMGISLYELFDGLIEEALTQQ